MTSLPGTAIMVDVERPYDPDLRGLQSEAGWLHASTNPLGEGDPGRFHALFGRDSLISSLQLMPVRPDIARATLRALADRQGRVIDPVTLESPGKIGHEFRPEPPRTLLDVGWPFGGEFNYFATADATSWFPTARIGRSELERSGPASRPPSAPR